MGYLFMIILGAAMGWLGAIVQRAASGRGLLLFVGAGLIGALLAGLVLSPALVGDGMGDTTYHVDELLVSLGGALASVGSTMLLRRAQLF